MNQAIIDNSLLGASFLAAVGVSYFLKERKTGIWFGTFLLLPSLLIFLNMWAHTTAVSVINIRRYQAGSFQYNFTFYTHLLFGFVFITISGLNIHITKKFICGEKRQKRTIYLLNLLTSILFIPVGFINPIGFLPVIASMISSLILFFWSPFILNEQTVVTSQSEKVEEHEHVL